MPQTSGEERANPDCKIMTFRPTFEEFKDFSSYIGYMESQGAHRAGLAKVIPPKEWCPAKQYDKVEDMTIPAPIQQMVTGQQGLYQQYNIQKKPLTVKEYRKLAESDKYRTPRHIDYEDLERKYWKNITFIQPIYGADISGSLYDPGVKEWNINSLNTILDLINEDYGIKIEGVNTAYLYFGMWKTTFAWHTEDMDLYSINYVHFGAPKSWYAIPPEHGRRLERLACGFFPGSFQSCSQFLRHKMTLISPYTLKQYGIPFDKITQEPGEFMITFPYGYHCGYNHGFNCAESTNFATMRWIDYGKRAKPCACRKDGVKINMDTFVKNFQPEQYDQWKSGKQIIHIPDVDGAHRPSHSHESLGKRVSPNNDQRKRKNVSTTAARRHPITHPDKDSKSKDTKATKKRGRPKKEETKTSAEVKVEVKTEEDVPPALVPERLPSIQEELEQIKEKPAPQTEVVRVKQEPEDPLPARPQPVISSEKLVLTAKTSQVKVESTEDRSPPVLKPEERLPPFLKREDPLPSPEPPRKKLCAGNGATTPSKEPEMPTLISDNEIVDIVEISSTGQTEWQASQSSSTAGIPVIKKMSKPLRRHPISKAPPKSPTSVTKQESSDEDLPFGIEESLDTWMQSMAGLWVSSPPNFPLEKMHNDKMSKQDPYCAVCSLFKPYNTVHPDAPSGSNPYTCRLPRPVGYAARSLVLIPELCFAACSVSPSPLGSNPLIDANLRSIVLKCQQCSLQVHASCYGVSDPELHVGHWTCSRCEAEAWDAQCCLCVMRGGALKATTTGRWAHIICAIAVQEVSFESVQARGPINTSKVPNARIRLKCCYCKKIMKKGVNMGACIQCSAGKCALSFHVTCAHAAGMAMEPGDWPFSVYVICQRHTCNRERTRNRPLTDISVGQSVIAKHKNGRYYQCQVIGLTSQTFFEVNFDDGSYSNNLFPQDIESHNCERDGPPLEGTPVTVRWTDGILYNAVFVGYSTVTMYQVEFEDGSQLTVKREDVYTEDEDLPRRVRSRLVRTQGQGQVVPPRSIASEQTLSSEGATGYTKTSCPLRPATANFQSEAMGGWDHMMPPSMESSARYREMGSSRSGRRSFGSVEETFGSAYGGQNAAQHTVASGAGFGYESEASSVGRMPGQFGLGAGMGQQPGMGMMNSAVFGSAPVFYQPSFLGFQYYPQQMDRLEPPQPVSGYYGSELSPHLMELYAMVPDAHSSSDGRK
ncbi:lysine-specific demethylase 4C-like isoform X2 [Branchiostoma floridae x Branchiostoma japonicum]